MKCLFCTEPVFGNEATTIPGLGPSHKICLEIQVSKRRVFMDINLSSLTDEQLNNLMDLALSERNERQGSSGDIELF